MDGLAKHPVPIAQYPRIELLDVMRGFALCGILLANLVSFTGFYYLDLTTIRALPTADRATLFAIDWLIEGKFYAIFSILLGVGFGLQLLRSSSVIQKFKTYWLRRMLVLFGLDLCHMLLIWHGDILTLYSLLGITLLGFTAVSQKHILHYFGLLIMLPLLIHVLLVITVGGRYFWL